MALSEIQYRYDNTLVSDTSLRYLIPINFELTTEHHKVTCVSETCYKTCIYENSSYVLLLLWRKK